MLYRDFGVPQQADWHAPRSSEGAVFVATSGSAVLGTVRLVGVRGDARMQLRQLAVRPESRCSGVGRALVRAAEAYLRDSGGSVLWLYARENAYAFYERLGYEYTGETFVSELTGVPHRPMRKELVRRVV